MESKIFLENLKYPIGKFQKHSLFDQEILLDNIQTLKKFPKDLQNCIQNCGIDQLNFKYRPSGWTLKQVIHHCADSHTNAFGRIKLTLTENHPTIKPYDENLWANLPDGVLNNVQPSMQILEGIHFRWVILLESLNEADFYRTFFHPETQTRTTIFEATALYAWHCRHHLKHIKNGLISNGKYNRL